MSTSFPPFITGTETDIETLTETYAALLEEARVHVNTSLTYPNGSTSANAEAQRAAGLVALAQEIRLIYTGSSPLTIVEPPAS